jgi:glycosyltransferase involved in cell wall biosynthesis
MDASAMPVFDVVIPTRNRCPYAPDSKDAIRNPLIWTLESIAANNDAPIRNVIVVDDGSTDHTCAALQAISALRPQLRLLYLRLPRRRGSASARNYGARYGSSDWLLFTDDDCLFGQDTIRRAADLVRHLRERDGKTAALNLPYYIRRSTPAGCVPGPTIGKFDPRRGLVSGNFDAVPAGARAGTVGTEQLSDPLRVNNLGCTYAVERRRLLAAGGFPEDFDWVNSYGEETELAVRLGQVGGHLYYAADPRCHVVHMKYGAELPPVRAGNESATFTILQTPCTLAELSAWSNQSQPGSGNRVEPSYAIYSRILSYFLIIYLRSSWGAFRWLWNCHRDYVQAPASTPALDLPRAERAAIWRAAAWHGIQRALQLRKTSVLRVHDERRV